MSDLEQIKKCRYGREPVEIGIAKESERKTYSEENPRLCEMRRKYEFERDMKSCDYSLEALDI